MIKLGIEDLEKVSGGSYVEEGFDRFVMFNNGFGVDNLGMPLEFYGNREDVIVPKRYREQGWLAMKRQKEHFIKVQEKRNKRNYRKHRRIGQG